MTFNYLHNIYNKNIMIVYLTTNLINGKKYIGKDVKNNPKYLGSGSLLLEDIKIYGKQNFKKEIIEFCDNNITLEERENFWISYYNALFDNNYYNIRGNVKNWYSDASDEKKQYVKEKIRKSNKGQVRTDETKQKISNANKGKIKGNYHTNESKSKIGLKNKGRKCSNSTKKKISMAKKGQKHTDETKKKMSINRTGHSMYNETWRLKIGASNKGNKKSEECKKIMSVIKKGNTHRRKKVIQYTMDMILIKEWNSVLEAALSLGKKQGAGISDACNGRKKHIYGCIWKYKE